MPKDIEFRDELPETLIGKVLRRVLAGRGASRSGKQATGRRRFGVVSGADPLPVDLGDGAMVRRYVMDDLDAVWAVASGERERLGEWMPWVEAHDVDRHTT